jgi:hypothetical protein
MSVRGASNQDSAHPLRALRLCGEVAFCRLSLLTKKRRAFQPSSRFLLAGSSERLITSHPSSFC